MSALTYLHNISVGEINNLSANALWSHKVIETLLASTDKVLQRPSCNGTLLKPVEDVFSLFKEKGGRLLLTNKENSNFTYVWTGSFIETSYDKKSSYISFNGMITDPEVLELFQSLDSFVTKNKKDSIFTIIQSSYGLSVKNMGNASTPFISDNYLPEVVDDMEYIINAFAKSPPHGRIAILNGEPGSGKTHLIRSMLSKLDCIFLIVPSNLINSLDKPEFIPLLTQIKDDHEKPIIMIIEDGDTCLVTRKSDNMSTIAALLNLSDGILGSIIDIKFIISTNAYIKDIDAAILRPGRLCRQVHVGPLPYDHANKVYQRLTSDKDAELEYRKHYVLAEIYDKANNKDSVSIVNPTQRRTIGFQFTSSTPSNAILNKG